VRWAELIARIRDKKIAYRISVGRPGETRAVGGPRRKWVDNIKMDFLDIGLDGMNWIDLGQDRDQRKALINTVMNQRVP
jgi:hypothetical protein